MEIVIALVVLWGMARYGVTDVLYAAKGKPSPRQQLAAKRMDLKAKQASNGTGENRTPNRTPYRSGRHGGRSYLSGLWHDAWDDALAGHERNRTRRQDRRQAIADGRALRWRDQPGALRTFLRELGGGVADRWDQAWDKRTLNLHDKNNPPPVDTIDAPIPDIDVEVPQDELDTTDPGPDLPSADGQGPAPNHQPDHVPDLADPKAGDPSAPFCTEPDCSGRHTDNTPLEACDRDGCGGVLVPVGRTFHGAEGEVTFNTECSTSGCGRKRHLDDGWNPTRPWLDPFDELAEHEEVAGPTHYPTVIPRCNWCEDGKPATYQQLTTHPDHPDHDRVETACDEHVKHFFTPGPVGLAIPTFAGPVEPAQPVPDWRVPTPGQPDGTNHFPTITGGTPMSDTPVGEVTGLRSTLEWARQASASLAGSPASLEQVQAKLASHDVQGDPMTALARWQAAAAEMSAAAEEFSEAMEQHLVVTEAYEATGNQAGDKEFVTTN